MRKLTIRLIVVVSIFLLGIALPLIYLSSDLSSSPKQSAAFVQEKQELRLSIPENIWVQIFFKKIDERTKEANLANLRTTLLPASDIEVRLWEIVSYYGMDGIIIRRSASQWSGTYLHGFSKDPHVKRRYEEPLAVPRSGWEAAWERLVSAGLLSQPDASEVQCNLFGRDGLGYIVETNMNKTYRTYMYDNPMHAKCDEAKQMIRILQIVDDEFGLQWSGSESKSFRRDARTPAQSLTVIR